MSTDSKTPSSSSTRSLDKSSKKQQQGTDTIKRKTRGPRKSKTKMAAAATSTAAATDASQEDPSIMSSTSKKGKGKGKLSSRLKSPNNESAPPPPPPPQSSPPKLPSPPPVDDMLRDFISFEGFEDSGDDNDTFSNEVENEKERDSQAGSSRRAPAQDLKSRLGMDANGSGNINGKKQNETSNQQSSPHPSLPAKPSYIHGGQSNQTRPSNSTSTSQNGDYTYNTYKEPRGSEGASRGKKRKSAVMEYESEYPRKSQERLESRCEMPWCEKVDWLGGETDVVKILNTEIMAAAEWMAPTPEEHAVRERAIAQVKSVICSRWSRAQVFVFGSHETQLYLPGGDIDMVVDNSTFSFRNVREFFEPTIAILSRNGIILPEKEKQVERVYFAKVPIIKIVTAEGNIKIDISLNMTNGVQAGMIVKEYLVAMPAIRPLVLLLKSFTWRFDAHEVFNGGIGSYALICLVVSFLQQHPKIRHAEFDPLDNLGILFIELFELYGRNFNWETTGISIVHGGRYIDKRTSHLGQLSNQTGRNKPNNRISFCIEDPQNSTNDIAKGTWDTAYILEVFSKAYRKLIRNIGERKNEFNWREAKSAFDHGKKPMHPDWLDEEDHFDPNRMGLLAGVVGFDEASLEHRQGLTDIFAYRSMVVKPNAPQPFRDIKNKIRAKPLPTSNVKNPKSQAPMPKAPPPPRLPEQTRVSAIITDEADPAAAQHRNDGYFTSDEDDDSDLEVEVVEAPEETKPIKTAMAKKRKEAKERKKLAKISQKQQEAQVISDDDDDDDSFEIMPPTESNKGKTKSSSGYQKDIMGLDDETESERVTSRARASGSKGKQRQTENSAPVIHFSEDRSRDSPVAKSNRLTEDDIDDLAPQFANPDEDRPKRTNKRVKTNDKRAYWESKSGQNMGASANASASAKASTSDPYRDDYDEFGWGDDSAYGGGDTASGVKSERKQEKSDKLFEKNWRKMAAESAKLTESGKGAIETNADFISFDDL